LALAASIAATAGVALADGGKKEVDWQAVRKEIAMILDSNLDYDDGSYGPVLVRLAWHAAGTYDKNSQNGGSNGATMRFAPESSDGANAGLDIARMLIEPVKTKFPNASYADLWTLAGAVAVEEMGGPAIPWRPGRSDYVDASKVPPNGRLPDATQGKDHIRQVFYRMGFNDQEIVALLGAHTLGRCHLTRSGFDGPWTRAPTTFSNEFFRVLKEEQWSIQPNKLGKLQFWNASKDLMMLPADMALLADPEFKKWVDIYAKDRDRFFADFAKAFGKLLELGVPYDSKPLVAPPALSTKPLWKRWLGW